MSAEKGRRKRRNEVIPKGGESTIKSTRVEHENSRGRSGSICQSMVQPSGRRRIFMLKDLIRHRLRTPEVKPPNGSEIGIWG
jgi:hypothetical protein